jgi:hypothetical protein
MEPMQIDRQIKLTTQALSGALLRLYEMQPQNKDYPDEATFERARVEHNARIIKVRDVRAELNEMKGRINEH